MQYTEKVMDHFMNPHNVGVIENPSGYGYLCQCFIFQKGAGYSGRAFPSGISYCYRRWGGV